MNNIMLNKLILEEPCEVGGEGMSGWKECKLVTVVEKANTGLDAIKRAPIVNYDSDIKCLRIQDISQNKEFKHWGFCEVTENNYKRFALKQDDIIIARTGASIGVNLIIKKDLKSVYNNGLIRLIINNNICDCKYIYYNLQSTRYKNFIESISGGTSTQPNMQINVLLDFDLLIPPLPEQRAIAGVLSSLDDKIDLLHRQNKTLEGMAEALWRKMFVGEAGPGWQKGKLGDIIDLSYGKGLKETVRTNGHYPVIGSSGIVGSHTEYLVKGPGIVIGRKGTLGKVNYIFENFYPIDTTYYVISKMNSKGLYYEYFLLKEVDFSEMNTDSAVPGLNRDIALSQEIIIPIMDSIHTFNNYCDSLFQKLRKNDNQIRTLSKMRDTLLPKLMSGEVRVKL